VVQDILVIGYIICSSVVEILWTSPSIFPWHWVLGPGTGHGVRALALGSGDSSAAGTFPFGQALRP